MVQVIRKTPSLLLRLPVTTHTQQQHQAATTAMMVASPSSQATSQERGAHQPPELRGIEAPGPALGDPWIRRGPGAARRVAARGSGWTTVASQTRVVGKASFSTVQMQISGLRSSNVLRNTDRVLI